MAEKTQPALTHKTFWTRMEQNTRCVEQMPNWVKGSPLNQRSAAAGAGASSSEEASNAPESPKSTNDR